MEPILNRKGPRGPVGPLSGLDWQGAPCANGTGAPLVGGPSGPNYLKIMQKLAVSAFGGPSDTRLAQGVPNTSPGLYVWIEVDETNRLI